MTSFHLYDQPIEYKTTFGFGISVDQFVDKLNPGDLIFSRSDCFSSKIIQFSGHCHWNHVAIVAVDPLNPREKYWCESSPVSYSRDGKNGVQRWPIRSTLKEYVEKFHCTLQFGVAHLQKQLDEKQIQLLWNFWTSHVGLPYSKSIWHVMLSWIDGVKTLRVSFFPCCVNNIEQYYDSLECKDDEFNQSSWAQNKETKGEYFCSQIIVETLRDIGVMANVILDPKHYNFPPKHIPSTEYTVADLVSHEYLNYNLIREFTYSKIQFYILKKEQ